MIINTHLKTPVVWGWSALEFRLQANTWVKFFAEGFCRLYIKGELCRSYAKGLEGALDFSDGASEKSHQRKGVRMVDNC
jgi:hypothetical protein